MKRLLFGSGPFHLNFLGLRPQTLLLLAVLSQLRLMGDVPVLTVLVKTCLFVSPLHYCWCALSYRTYLVVILKHSLSIRDKFAAKLLMFDSTARVRYHPLPDGSKHLDVHLLFGRVYCEIAPLWVLKYFSMQTLHITSCASFDFLFYSS